MVCGIQFSYLTFILVLQHYGLQALLVVIVKIPGVGPPAEHAPPVYRVIVRIETISLSLELRIIPAFIALAL